MKLKILLLTAVIILIVLAVSQLMMSDDEKRNVDINSGYTQESGKQYKTIGIVVHNMKHMFMANVASMIKEKAKENENIRILLYDSEGINDKQLLQLRELIDLKVDGIILNPNDRDLINPGIEEVKKAGIPIITVNMNASSELVDCYVGSDPVQAGEFQGNFVAEKLKGKGNIVVLAGQAGQDAADDRLKGLQNVIEKYPGIHITDVQYGDWDRRKGTKIMQDIINQHKQIDAVVSQNDEMLLGALHVLDRYGLKPVTIGVDAIPEALEAVKEGRIDATVYQNGRAQAAGAYDMMTKIFSNGAVEKIKWIPYELVTSDNIDDYINKNFKIK